MITERDLEEAIAECQGRRNPDAKTCMMLAAFLTIKKEMYGSEPLQPVTYSFAADQTERPPIRASGSPAVGEYGQSEFLGMISGIPEEDAWKLMDELMDTVKIISPRLYRGVMHQIKEQSRDA